MADIIDYQIVKNSLYEMEKVINGQAFKIRELQLQQLRQQDSISTTRNFLANQAMASLMAVDCIKPYRGTSDDRTVLEFLREFSNRYGDVADEPRIRGALLYRAIDKEWCSWAKELNIQTTSYEKLERELESRYWTRKNRQRVIEKFFRESDDNNRRKTVQWSEYARKWGNRLMDVGYNERAAIKRVFKRLPEDVQTNIDFREAIKSVDHFEKELIEYEK